MTCYFVGAFVPPSLFSCHINRKLDNLGISVRSLLKLYTRLLLECSVNVYAKSYNEHSTECRAKQTNKKKKANKFHVERVSYKQ